MERCVKCGFPNTRPGIIFKDGVCGACINYDKRKFIDWTGREAELERLCAKYRGKGKYDCLIPVSGGKDSHFLVHTLVKEYGMRPLLLTVTDSFTHTKAGTFNLRNLITQFNLNHWQYTISHDLFRRATRAAFEETGESLKFVEYAIYTIPVQFAAQFGIGLVFFGENSGYEYGSREENTFDANPDVAAMVKKVQDEEPMWLKHQISQLEIASILPPIGWEKNVQVAYMSFYKPWSSVTNHAIAKRYGFRDLTGEWDRKGTIENFEQIDSVAYMQHLWMKYPKYGFQRVSDIACRRVREGLMSKAEAAREIYDKDPVLDPWARKDFIDFCGYSEQQYWDIVQKHWNPEVPKS